MTTPKSPADAESETRLSLPFSATQPLQRGISPRAAAAARQPAALTWDVERMGTTEGGMSTFRRFVNPEKDVCGIPARAWKMLIAFKLGVE